MLDWRPGVPFRNLFTLRHLAYLLALASWILVSPATAEAQLYTWREPNGTLVISTEPRAGASPVRNYPVKYAKGVRTTTRTVTEYPAEFDSYIEYSARRFNVRPDLVRAIVQVESGFDPYARSPKGAMGLMQLMPATAYEMGVRNPYHPAENIRGGVAYLRQLLDRYDGNEELALAAYNAGPEAVARYGNQVPPYRETQNYVRQISARTSIWDARTQGAPNRPTSQSSSKPAPSKRTVLYKVVRVVNGKLDTFITDQQPASGPYEVVR